MTARVRALAALLAVVAATPALPQARAELEAQLEAQIRINALLKQRIRVLEAQLAARREPGAAGSTATTARPAVPPSPRRPAADPEGDRALERALVRRGRAILAPGVLEVTPGFDWTHSGRSLTGTTDDLYAAGIDIRLGLSRGWMVGIGGAALHRATGVFGDNTGLGDSTLTVWKEIAPQQGAWPALVASLRYIAPTGEDFTETAVPLGSGFHQLSGQLTAVRAAAPLAFYGDLSYTHSFSRKFGGVEFERGGVIGAGFGATLAVTPDVSASAGLRFAFEDAMRRNGVALRGTDRTIGAVELGLGVVLSRNLFLNLSGAFGITDDTPDVTLGVSLPIRF